MGKFVLLAKTPNRDAARSLCHLIEELNIPVLMTHSENDFSVFVPADESGRLRERTLFGQKVHQDRLVVNG